MKQIKDLKISSREGFKVYNLQRFPSMEWGDEGGLQADVFYQGKKAFTVFQEGEGGCATTYFTDYGRAHEQEIKIDTLEFLKRNDESYGENSEFDWLKEKTASKINDDDYEALVNCFEERYENVKECSKFFKKNYLSCLILNYDWKTKYLGCNFFSKKEADDYMAKNYPNENYKSSVLVMRDQNLIVF